MTTGNGRRALIAFLIAPAAPVVLYCAGMLTLYFFSTQRPHEEQLFVLIPAILLYGALLSCTLTWVLGWPLYFVLHKLGKLRQRITLTLAGLLGAVLPIVVEIRRVLGVDAHDGALFSSGRGGRVLIRDNVRTAFGYLDLAKDSVTCAVLAAITAWVFWRVYTGSWRNESHAQKR
jgi:hypothetical protein